MKTRIVLIIVATLLGCGWSWAQVSTPASSAPGAPAVLPGAMAARPEPAYADLLARLRSVARQSDSDLAYLRIERWKARGHAKEQFLDVAASIHRNLKYAVPELLQQAAAEPESIRPMFVLYRDLNVLYEAFSSLAESAGAFGPSSDYNMLAGDLSQLEQLRHELADRLERVSTAADARRDAHHGPVRAGDTGASKKASSGSSVHKIIVDENHPRHHRRSRKKTVKKSQ